MPRKFLTPIDLAGFELQNARLHVLSSDPAGLVSGDKGLTWFNSTSNRLTYWNGSAAELKATDSDLLQGQNGAYHLARANHSGTQLAMTVTLHASSVQTNGLDQFTAPNTDLSLASNKLTNVTDPTGDQDAATRGWTLAQIASLTTGQTLKGAVEAATTSNINIASPGATLDGITASNGEIYLLTAQSTGSQNGPYAFNGSGSAMTRATNWDVSAEAVMGSYWIVKRGTHADEFALLSNDTAITLGTTTPTFVFRGSAGATYTAGNGLTLSGSDFNVGAGTGISVAADAVAIDTAVVARYVKGVIPTSTTGIYTVSGAAVTVNHGLNNFSARPHVTYYTSPGGGNTQGDPLEVQYNNPDANNTVFTFPGAPSSNQYHHQISG